MAPKKIDSSKTGKTVSMVGVKAVSAVTLEKLQMIANLEGISFNEIYNLAFINLVKAYEAKHGPVKLRPPGKGLEGLL